MAFGGILQGIAVGIGIGSALVVVYAILGGIWWEVLVRGLEEAYLAKKFGEPFERFRAQVPCWRFRLRAYRDS
jgi:protein-S-isoprenylcysteine O-methyltransferase Ste14